MKVLFHNKKHQGLVGLLEAPKKSDKIVIFLHGLKGDKDYYSFFHSVSKELMKYNISVFRIDLNSHGESDSDWKNFTRRSTADDLDAAYTFAQSKGYKHVGVFATSMGTETFMLRPEGIDAAVLYNPSIVKSIWERWIAPYAAVNEKRGHIELTQAKTGEKVRYGLSLQEETLKGIDIKTTKVPTLVLFGENDDSTEKERKYTVTHFTGHHAISIIKGAGHWRTTPKQDLEIADHAIRWYRKYL